MTKPAAETSVNAQGVPALAGMHHLKLPGPGGRQLLLRRPRLTAQGTDDGAALARPARRPQSGSGVRCAAWVLTLPSV